MKKKMIVIVAILALIIVGVIGYFATLDLKQGVTLRKEVGTIGKLDITKDEIDMTIKTKGDYAVVEKTIKEYLNNYSINIKEAMNIMQDKKMAEILTVDNYKNDGPEFTNSKEYISKAKTDFNEKMELLINMTSEEKMMQEIENKNLDSNFVELYRELMLGDKMEEDLKEMVKSLEEASTTINNILDTQEKVINLLINNKGKWEVKGNQIQFSTQKLVNEYNDLIRNL
ncbi:MAG: hypothetical protein HFJ41_05970 [Clostridia bacterium]|nr:hypothetical protein [Clostridia bacterium]